MTTEQLEQLKKLATSVELLEHRLTVRLALAIHEEFEELIQTAQEAVNG